MYTPIIRMASQDSQEKGTSPPPYTAIDTSANTAEKSKPRLWQKMRRVLASSSRTAPPPKPDTKVPLAPHMADPALQPNTYVQVPQQQAVACSIDTFHCHPNFCSAVDQIWSQWTAQLGLCWYHDKASSNNSSRSPSMPLPTLPTIPASWRGNLHHCVADEIAVAMDPLCPCRKAFVRTVSVDYIRGLGSPDTLVLRTSHTLSDPHSTVVARVSISIYCRDRKMLENLSHNKMGEYITPQTAIL
ncbi:hypothetical protein B0T25DRAFT_542393 [Lasiosphaeria hispida]|uniref:Thioesterase domain-containing protein n=1 Tax=Lasiosphaeria hispida TaxID=260671 RepID=A0AAJ0HHQ7_9PEZI|nr:hypothetical protein B0T25DRAFT_542393 [Lasiosphaeria hispida]